MIFEWDESKNQKNIEKHGFGFARAATIFNHPTFDREDTRKDYGEARIISIGLMEDVLVIVVAHTQREGTIRIISARRANQKEQADYEKFKRKITG